MAWQVNERIILMFQPYLLLGILFVTIVLFLAYNMFDFTPVGSIISLAGILFVSFLGWRFLPKRRPYKQAEELFLIPDYMTEAKIQKNSSFVNKTIKEIEEKTEADFQIITILNALQQRKLHRGIAALCIGGGEATAVVIEMMR